MKSILLSLVAAFVLLVPAVASAKDVDLSKGPVMENAIAPVTLNFVKINPFRFHVDGPSKKNVVVSAAPTPPASLVGQTPKPAATQNPQPPKGLFELLAKPTGLSDITDAVARIDAEIEQAKNNIVPLRTVTDTLMADNSGGTLVDKVSKTPEYVQSRQDFATLNVDRALLVKGQSTLKTLKISAKDSSDANTSITKAIQAIDSLKSTYPAADRGITVSDIERSISEDCLDVGAGSKTEDVNIVLTDVSDSTTKWDSTIKLTCPSRFSYSGGFVFSQLPQRTFVAQAVPSPAPSPALGATVQESTIIPVRTTVFAFAHYAVSRACVDNCLYLTFGTGLQSGSNTNGTTVDFATGLSVGLARYMFITAGAHLAQFTDLAPGYTVGTPVATGFAIPTVTRQRPAFFIGITFGNPSSSGTSTSNTNASGSTSSGSSTGNSSAGGSGSNSSGHRS